MVAKKKQNEGVLANSRNELLNKKISLKSCTFTVNRVNSELNDAPNNEKNSKELYTVTKSATAPTSATIVEIFLEKNFFATINVDARHEILTKNFATLATFNISLETKLFKNLTCNKQLVKR